MTKRRYQSPVLRSLTPDDDDPIIDFGGSQGTSGYDTPYTFDGISEDDLVLIGLNCDDLDLLDMDVDGNYIITNDEFQDWLDNRGGW